MKKPNISATGMSRRNFFKAVGAGGASLLLPGAARAESGVELATLLDLSKCIGCGACVDACRESNHAKFPEPEKPFPDMVPASRAKPEDWSDKRDVDDRLTPYNWLYIQTAEGTWNGEEYEINIPRRCMHCRNAPCANLCPFGAAARETNGIVRIYDQICFGGAKCRAVCPWHIPQRQSGVGLYRHVLPRLAGNGVMYKCDRCYQLVEQGQLPACIEACPEDVQQIGPREEMLEKAYALAREMDGYVYGDKENGGTNTFYVSPVPFEELDAAVQKGRGRPHLSPAGDVMKDETNLAVATVIAPVAGIAAGVLGLGARLAGNGEKGGDHED